MAFAGWRTGEFHISPSDRSARPCYVSESTCPTRLSSLISGMNPDLARRMLRSAYHEFRDALRTEYRASWLYA